LKGKKLDQNKKLKKKLHHFSFSTTKQNAPFIYR